MDIVLSQYLLSHSSSDISRKIVLFYSKVLNTTMVEMRVHMDCPGCESKIKKALQKLDGVNDIDIEVGMQKVTVTGSADWKKVLKTVRKTGRKAELWPFPYNPEYHNYYHKYHNQSYATTHYTSLEPSSSYNYRVHGYNGHDHGYFHPAPNSAILDDRTSTMFSDENPNACSIM